MFCFYVTIVTAINTKLPHREGWLVIGVLGSLFNCHAIYLQKGVRLGLFWQVCAMMNCAISACLCSHFDSSGYGSNRPEWQRGLRPGGRCRGCTISPILESDSLSMLCAGSTWSVHCSTIIFRMWRKPGLLCVVRVPLVRGRHRCTPGVWRGLTHRVRSQQIAPAL